MFLTFLDLKLCGLLLGLLLCKSLSSSSFFSTGEQFKILLTNDFTVSIIFSVYCLAFLKTMFAASTFTQEPVTSKMLSSA